MWRELGGGRMGTPTAHSLRVNHKSRRQKEGALHFSQPPHKTALEQHQLKLETTYELNDAWIERCVNSAKVRRVDFEARSGGSE